MKSVTGSNSTRAAQYVRMSTDHQQYSTENQSDAIQEYALKHGLTIVRTYTDSGKSGLRLEGRLGLQQLIKDVQGTELDFSVLLVYDVSRWGRFQDADESAYYEYLLKSAGVVVAYCAEQFTNDGSPVSTIIKSVKRAMAGEYSRELSSKVFKGQCRLIELGFRQGGPAGFGLRRMLLTEKGEFKATLQRGERKSLQMERVILVPGPPEEVAIVKDIYKSFLELGLTEAEIANRLNERALIAESGRAWTRASVRQVLTNEKYVGNNVFNRRSFKLKQKRVNNPPEMWVRKEHAFEPIVEPSVYSRVRELIQSRTRKFTDDELLGKLRQLLQEKGSLSGIIIDEALDLPTRATFVRRFGSLVRSYTLIGYAPARDYRYIEINRHLRAVAEQTVLAVQEALERCDASTSYDADSGLLIVEGHLRIQLVVARCHCRQGGRQKWHLRFEHSMAFDLLLAVRLEPDAETIHDYYIFPRSELTVEGMRLSEENGLGVDAFRFDSLDALAQIAAYTRIGVA